MESARYGIIETKSSCDYGLKSTMTKQQDDIEQYQSTTTTIILILYIYLIDIVISLLCCKIRTTCRIIFKWKLKMVIIIQTYLYKNHSMSGMQKFFLDWWTLCFSYVQSGNLNYFIRSCKYFDCHFCKL